MPLKSLDMNETAGLGSVFKTRRSHKKSRNGCSKCKQRRIKCDELTPKCSRCKKMNLNCQYPQKSPSSLASEDFWIDPLLLQFEDFRTDCATASSENSDHSSAIGGSPLSSSSSTPPSQSLLAVPKHIKRSDSPLRSQVAQTLAPIEFELLKHYLEHTCRDMTVDDDDQYTLQTGIPNLACQSKPLMKSVLAIAAVCKCCDIIKQPSTSREDRDKVLELLSLAHGYHMESLRGIQATLSETKHYDHVLANAALMGMYGSGSHCARIWLAKTATSSDQPLGDFMPKHSQWISLFRAVHLAYGGLLNDTQGMDDNVVQLSPGRPLVDPIASSGSQIQYEYKISSRVEQQRTPPNHALFSILAATVGSALDTLRQKVRDIAMVQASNEINSHHTSTPPASYGNPDLQSCYTALTLLGNIVSETFPTGDSLPSTPGRGHLAFEVDIDPVGRLSEVSPWLRKYTASITSMIPSRLPRRFIMAFIHKAPTKFLNLVEEILSFMQANTDNGEETWTPSTLEPSIAHQLAVEIFAHWLVLVILLDNVWWIGGIGAWELGRVVSLRKDARWRMCMWNRDEDWWPESMFEVNRHFDKHRTKN
ncbi:uncharacterized protein TRUGW13939_00204 [Talaromyces rugulosus]|uniref:Zn(2)-C6 fungal-type domain-containing protein n=1 Tax=Talaromyces rugulosus TaxID=121627 RepID=A0A7H8QGR3_TALRU|nr:uncharacterized protein TRUGW13939_00204 [Talaromyces rugulosus]QKX53130.1 hypothetical protein TRUGW13939_00204 [Talaromyces rugulosus]